MNPLIGRVAATDLMLNERRLNAIAARKRPFRFHQHQTVRSSTVVVRNGSKADILAFNDVGFFASELLIRHVVSGGNIVPAQHASVDYFGTHVFHEGSAQSKLMPLPLFVIRIEVVGEDEPFDELIGSDWALRRDKVINVQMLGVLHASAKPPLHACHVHQCVIACLRHRRRMGHSSNVRNGSIADTRAERPEVGGSWRCVMR